MLKVSDLMKHSRRFQNHKYDFLASKYQFSVSWTKGFQCLTRQAYIWFPSDFNKTSVVVVCSSIKKNQQHKSAVFFSFVQLLNLCLPTCFQSLIPFRDLMLQVPSSYTLLSLSSCPTLSWWRQREAGADSLPCCQLVIYGGNYSSALLHGHTAHFKSQWVMLHGWEKLAFWEKKRCFFSHTRRPKPKCL